MGSSNKKLQAFADDFIFTITSDNRKEMEKKSTTSSQKFMTWAINEKLQISEQKPKQWYLAKGQYKRKPLIRLNNTTIKCYKELNYLGVTFDQNLNFIPHLKNQKEVLIHANRLAAMTGRGWGVNPKIIRKWYKNCHRTEDLLRSIHLGRKPWQFEKKNNQFNTKTIRVKDNPCIQNIP
ncbi:hypothetical protein CEXT_702851 [Caerostris extrusa]|uniref:Reverse transcriptase domain-containing protein n=1 Tax=Caerostris extrusa TaxID=172846 RepID=A0AAV4N854_CAEEX|nr:hypothetical protein CEXT_702851 [Caerostris extrusa]